MKRFIVVCLTGTQHDGVTDTRDDSLFNGVSGHQPNFAEAEKEQVGETTFFTGSRPRFFVGCCRSPTRWSLDVAVVAIDRLVTRDRQSVEQSRFFANMQ